MWSVGGANDRELGFARVILWSLACSRRSERCLLVHFRVCRILQPVIPAHLGDRASITLLCVRCSGTRAIRRSCSRSSTWDGNSALAVGGFTFERIDLLITLLAAAVTLIVLRAVALRVRDVLLNRSLMWCYAVLLAIGSSVSLPAEYGLASMAMEGVLVGVPFACMLAAWGRALGARSHGESSRGVLLATAVAAVFTFLLAVVCSQAPLAAAVANLLPFGSAWALVGVEPLLSSERVEENADCAKKTCSHYRDAARLETAAG